MIRGGRTTTAPGARRAPERWLAAALRVAEQRDAAAVQAVVVAETARLLGARVVLLTTEAPAGRTLAAARLPRGDDAGVLLRLVSPWIDEAARTRSARLRHGPEGADTRAQRSCLVAPLTVGAEVLGVLYADVDGASGRFDDAHCVLLVGLARHAAAALARLRDRPAQASTVNGREATSKALTAQRDARAEKLGIVNRIQQGMAAELNLLARGDPEGASARDAAPAGDIGLRWSDHGLGLAHYRLHHEPGKFFLEPVRRQDDGALVRALEPATGPRRARTKAELAAWRIDDSAQSPATRSIVVAPIRGRQGLLGSVAMEDARPAAFGDAEVDLVGSVAASMATALENARLFEETERLRKETEQRNAELAVINSIQQGLVAQLDLHAIVDLVGDKLREVFATGDLAIAWIDEDTWVATPAYVYEHGERLADVAPFDARRNPVNLRIVRDRVAIAVNTRAEDGERPVSGTAQPMSYMRAPLIAGGRVVGVVVVESFEREHAFGPSEIRLLQTIVGEMGVALENARLFDETQRLLREKEEHARDLAESLDYQTAISEVLRVISQSPTDVTPVFEAILGCATRLFGSAVAAIYRYDGRLVSLAATRNWPTEALALAHSLYPAPPDQAQLAGRTILLASVQSLDDALTDASYNHAFAAAGSWRRVMGAPMLRDGVPVGAILVGWPDPGRTPVRQIELIKTFADQAVIAIENVRLLNETKEALERQTATAEVLRVISASVTETQPVFDVIAERAVRLTGAICGWVFRFDGEQIHIASAHGVNQRGLEAARKAFPMPPGTGSATARAVRDGIVVNIGDVATVTDADYTDPKRCGARGLPCGSQRADAARRRNRRCDLGDEDRRGCLRRARGRPSRDVRQPGRDRDREREAVQRNAGSARAADRHRRDPEGDRQLAERRPAGVRGNREQLEPAHRGPVDCRLPDRGRHLAPEGVHSDQRGIRRMLQAAFPLPLTAYPAGEQIRPGASQMADVEVDWAAQPNQVAMARKRGFRSALWSPLMRDGVAIGMISVTRVETGAFEPHHVELLKTFSDQAVIAIENVRLFNETKEALEQQTATAEILRVISGSATDATAGLRRDRQELPAPVLGKAVAMAMPRGEMIELVAYGATYGR